MAWFKAQAFVLAMLLAGIFAAWGCLFYQHAQMSSQPMSSMWMPPSETTAWQFMDFVLVYFMWAVMMAAMMLPSAIPMILAFARVCRQQNKPANQLTAIFSSAYLGIWMLFSSLLTLLQWQMHGLAWLSPMMENQNTILAAGILFLAGFYQFMPIKNACLTHCQTPMGFLLNEWQNGSKGAFNMGLKHGTNLCRLLLGTNADHVCCGRNESIGNVVDHLIGDTGEIHPSRIKVNLQSGRYFICYLGHCSFSAFTLTNVLNKAQKIQWYFN